MIFHKYRLVYIGIAKNASASIFHRLQNATDQRFEHFDIFDILSSNDIKLLKSYYILSTVRNPYDRFYSAYLWIHVNNLDQEVTEKEIERGINEYVNRIYASSEKWYYDIPHLRPQHDYISFRDKIMVDRIFRFEHLQDDWKKFVTEYNTYSEFKLKEELHKQNESPKRLKDWRQMYSPETKKKLHELYRTDFELFGYDSEL
jgi:hypothetical protein